MFDSVKDIFNMLSRFAGEVLLAPSKQRPEMLLNISPAQASPTAQMSVVLRLRNPGEHSDWRIHFSKY